MRYSPADAMESLIVDGLIQHPTDRLIRALTPDQFRTWSDAALTELAARASKLTVDQVLALIDESVPGQSETRR